MPEHSLAVGEPSDGEARAFYDPRAKSFYRWIEPVPVAFPSKCLFAAPMAERGRERLREVVRRFGGLFDYWLFVYDGSGGWREEFPGCRFLEGWKLRKWGYMKEYLHPAALVGYDYVFCWDDDLDLLDFDVVKYLETVCRNGLEVSQPALTEDSHRSWEICVRDPLYPVGRFTNFVEVMCPVFTRRAWGAWWRMLDPWTNGWGWGYDQLAFTECRYARMGVVDSQCVRHAMPVVSGATSAPAEMAGLLALKGRRLFALYTYCGLR